MTDAISSIDRIEYGEPPAKKKAKRGKPPWTWRVTGYLKGGAVASQTVHNSELAKDLQVEALKARDDIRTVEVKEA